MYYELIFDLSFTAVFCDYLSGSFWLSWKCFSVLGDFSQKVEIKQKWSWALRKFPLGWLDLGFNIISVYPRFIISYDPFKQCPFGAAFIRNSTVSEQILLRFLPKMFEKIARPNDTSTSSATSQTIIRRLTIIIYFSFFWRHRLLKY